MSETRNCPKCGGEMANGSDQNLNDYFRCTRPPSDSKSHEQNDYRIQSYYCEICGYIEFYRERRNRH